MKKKGITNNAVSNSNKTDSNYEAFISEKEAARLTGYTVESLRKFRSRGSVDAAGQISGPQYYKIARKILYKPSEVVGWVEQYRVG